MIKNLDIKGRKNISAMMINQVKKKKEKKKQKRVPRAMKMMCGQQKRRITVIMIMIQTVQRKNTTLVAR